MTLEQIFHTKSTENGDLSFNTVGDAMLDILFLTEYYQKHQDELPLIGNSTEAKLFAKFMRDPRYGMGRRDIGRILMSITDCSNEEILKCGRADDIWKVPVYKKMYGLCSQDEFVENLRNALNFLRSEILKGNELVKKWMPRYSSKDMLIAREVAAFYNMNKQQYGKFIKCNTVENKLSRKNYDEIEFDKLPSLAAIKYAAAFNNNPEMHDRYQQYLADVRAGKKDLKISTTTVYDIYKNRDKIDADLFFDKLEKISGSWIPIVDTSGSMFDNNDSFGKAISIGHYLAKCSSYCPNKVISFSSNPQLITLGESQINVRRLSSFERESLKFNIDTKSQYQKEINSIYTGDCSNTNFGKVMNLLANLDGNMPEYLIVLSDMEFDAGSSMSKDKTMELFKSKGYNTKIIWWNFNSRNITCPEMDSDGNIFISGYNPMLLKYLEVGFDGKKFLTKLLEEYEKNIE